MVNSASPVMASSVEPQQINWRLARRWMAVNAGGATLLAARDIQFYAAARASGFHAPAQLWVRIAEWLVLMIVVGAAQAAACSWAFSYIDIAQRTLRGVMEAFLGLVSGFVFPLLGMAMLQMPDATLGAWIFVPTGTVFGWLVASSQSAWYPQQIAAAKVERPARKVLNGLNSLWRVKVRWRLTFWWMVVNAVGVTLARILAGGSGNLYFLLILIVLGVLHATASSIVISFVRMRNKAVRIALGVALGLVVAILTLVLGMFFLWVYAALVFWVFVPSGILFGWLLTRSPVAGSAERR